MKHLTEKLLQLEAEQKAWRDKVTLCAKETLTSLTSEDKDKINGKTFGDNDYIFHIPDGAICESHIVHNGLRYYGLSDLSTDDIWSFLWEIEHILNR